MAGTPVEEKVADRSSSRRPSPIIAVAALAVAALLVGGWVFIAAQQRSQVAVWFDGEPLECLGATPIVEELEAGSEPLYAHAIDAAPDLDCRLRVQVENRGRLPVTLRGVELPMYGPGTGGGVRARELSPLALRPVAEDDTGWPPRDAIYTLDYRLEAGDRLVLGIGLEHNPEGCMAPGALAWLTDAPTVDVSVLGLGGTRAPPGVAFAQRGSADSRC